MNPASKFILRDKLKEKFSELTDDVIYNIISELDKMNALNENLESTPNKGLIEERPAKGLPTTFNMISPLWKGKVTLIQKEGFYGYKDSEGNVRLHAATERDLLKKVAKYNK